MYDSKQREKPYSVGAFWIVNGSVDQGNLSKCIVQWGCSIESGSNAEQSLFCEHTTSSCNAKIVNSIIGMIDTLFHMQPLTREFHRGSVTPR